MNFKIVPIPPPVTATYTIVPDVIGDKREEAEKEINGVNLICTVTEESSQAAPGIVIRQDPPANSSTQVGSSVNIVISKKS